MRSYVFLLIGLFGLHVEARRKRRSDSVPRLFFAVSPKSSWLTLTSTQFMWTRWRCLSHYHYCWRWCHQHRHRHRPADDDSLLQRMGQHCHRGRCTFVCWFFARAFSSALLSTPQPYMMIFFKKWRLTSTTGYSDHSSSQCSHRDRCKVRDKMKLHSNSGIGSG